MSAALPAARTFAVAPAAVWRLLWLWVPLLGCAALIVVGTLQSDQRTTHELALTVPFLALLLAVLTWAFFRRRITLQGSTLDVTAAFYRRQVPVQAMMLAKARVVDLAGHDALRPRMMLNGYGVPGFNAGHYRLRDGNRAYCLLTDASRVLHIPLHDGSVLLLSPEQPRALLAALQALAGPAATH
ncbi:PH domain-containing protein [Stenotrophomonas sp. NPDC101269]|uniref:PH domain-containing protein n=1 Tax=Stenotrophomonas TaxID=40323 RepID=UPI0012916148|nr:MULTISPECIES: PH domain-containing protein [Stenotrophomonas]